MSSSDLDQLIEMGFDKERAEMAVAKSGGLQGALEWLEQNQDKSIEEIKATASNDDAGEEGPPLQPGEEARSLVCNECGKKFRSHAQAEFHASKTQHVDFEESTEELAPLTDEEKKAKLEALRAKLAEKRAGQSEQDKADKKRNEVSGYVPANFFQTMTATHAPFSTTGNPTKEQQGITGRQGGAPEKATNEGGGQEEEGEAG